MFCTTSILIMLRYAVAESAMSESCVEQRVRSMSFDDRAGAGEPQDLS